MTFQVILTKIELSYDFSPKIQRTNELYLFYLVYPYTKNLSS